MELQPAISSPQIQSDFGSDLSRLSPSSFIEANTREISLRELRDDCIIPVFAKDNESTISHPEFIEVVGEVASRFYSQEMILNPRIRVSHPIKGRIPKAKGKPAHLLTEEEKTIYYERMAFLIEIPSVLEIIEGNIINLSIGGVRAYNHENLYNRKSAERFKLFVGFQNRVCTNLLVSTDGCRLDLRLYSVKELAEQTYRLLEDFRMVETIKTLASFPEHRLSERQFAQLVGRARMYPYLPAEEQKLIPALELQDTQFTQVVRGYYQDPAHGRFSNGDITLWNLYNLFTAANKSSYVDRFLERGRGAFEFVLGLYEAVGEGNKTWYLN